MSSVMGFAIQSVELDLVGTCKASLHLLAFGAVVGTGGSDCTAALKSNAPSVENSSTILSNRFVSDTSGSIVGDAEADDPRNSRGEAAIAVGSILFVSASTTLLLTSAIRSKGLIICSQCYACSVFLCGPIIVIGGP